MIHPAKHPDTPIKSHPESLNTWIETLFTDSDMLDMGHAQSKDDLNLGMGWLYYSLVRMQRAERIVVIGSYRGFTPLVFARALQDNQSPGPVHFIDPSLVDPFWQDPERVQTHFARFGINNICHHLQTTQSFIGTPAYDALTDIDILFVDGYHSHAQAKFDHQAFQDKLSDQAVVLFHDSISTKSSRLYGEDKRYAYSVVDYIDELKADSRYQVLDFDITSGLSLVKRAR